MRLFLYPLLLSALLSGCGGYKYVERIRVMNCETTPEGHWGFRCENKEKTGWCAGSAELITNTFTSERICLIRVCDPDNQKLMAEESCHCWCEHEGEGYGNDAPCVVECMERKLA